MVKSFFSTLIFLSIIYSNTICAEEWGIGPFEIRNQFPLHRHHLSFFPISPEVKEEGEYSIASTLVTSNTSLLYDSYRIDSESREINIGLGCGIAKDLEVGVSSGLLWQGGGVLDSSIDSWHQFFGLPRGKRDRLPENDFAISGETDAGTFVFDDRGTDLGLTTIYGKYLLNKGSETLPALSLRIESLIPVSTVDEAPSNSDLSLGLLLSKRFSSMIFYGGGTYIRFLDEESNSLRYRSGHVEGFLAAEYEWYKDLSLNLGWTIFQEPTENLAAGPSHTSYLDMGLQYSLSDDLSLSLLVRENPGPRKLSTDVTGLLGLKFTHRP